MTDALDALDRKILSALQQDATRSLDELAALVGSSKTPVWNRIRKLRERGVIDRQVAVLNPAAVGLNACFFVLIRTSRHEKAWLEAFVAALRKRPEVIEAIKRPAERLPWHRYRSFFVNPAQIDKGVDFWREHAATLGRAERETGVPREIIVAIIGIETRYGATLGSHPVMDSLTTLTLQYPRRRAFFSEQLEHFLLLAHEQGLDSLAIRGSYAGAMGIPQFMPTSYRQYAVDFNGDGRIDLLTQTEDAIGSVANYLKRFKWQAGQPVALALASTDNLAPGLLDSDSRLPATAAELREAGVDPGAGRRGSEFILGGIREFLCADPL